MKVLGVFGRANQWTIQPNAKVTCYIIILLYFQRLMSLGKEILLFDSLLKGWQKQWATNHSKYYDAAGGIGGFIEDQLIERLLV